MEPIIAARPPVLVVLAPSKPPVVVDIAPSAPALTPVRPSFTPQRQVDWFGNQPGMPGGGHVN